MDGECRHLQNKITELQNKLILSDHYKNRLKSDIQDITTPVNLEQRLSKLIVSCIRQLLIISSFICVYSFKYSSIC